MSRVGPRANQVTARRDRVLDTLEVTVEPPGPAGAAWLGLADGRVEVQVDVAEPENLLSVDAEDLDDDTVRRVVGLLLGPMAARRIERVGDEEAVVWDRAADEPETTRARRGTGPGGLGVIGRAALTSAEVARPLVTDAATAIGLVEAGVTALDIAGGLDFRPDPLAMVLSGLSRWSDLDDDDYERLLPVAQEIVNRGQRWTKVLYAHDTEAAARLTGLLSELQEDAVPPAAAAAAAVADMADAFETDAFAAAMAPPPAALAGGVRSRLVRALHSEVAPPAQPAVRLGADLAAFEPRLVRVELDRNHLTVDVAELPDRPRVRDGRHGGGIWLRAFVRRRGRVVPLALAPFDTEGFRSRSAVAVLPADVTGDRLLIDVTGDPRSPWDSEATHRLREAIELGAHAARKSRRGDHDASLAWEDAGVAWEGAGDDDRSSRAHELAYRNADQRPLLTDLIDGA